MRQIVAPDRKFNVLRLPVPAVRWDATSLRSRREPYAAANATVLRWAEAGGATAVAWHSLTNCAYRLKGGGRPFLERLLRLVEVAPAAKR